MELKDFSIGVEFYCGDKRWRCTDIGSRVVVAICLDHDDDPSWYNGPPYAVNEEVFDEYDMKGCSLSSEDSSDDSSGITSGAVTIRRDIERKGEGLRVRVRREAAQEILEHLTYIDSDDERWIRKHFRCKEGSSLEEA